MARGSVIKLVSSEAGVLPLTGALSPGTRLGWVADALRHKWSEVSDKNEVVDLENNEVRPRFRFERIISSKSFTEGSSARVDSRSWMNSLNACVWRSMFMYSLSPCGTLFKNWSMLKWYIRPAFRRSPDAGCRYRRYV